MHLGCMTTLPIGSNNSGFTAAAAAGAASLRLQAASGRRMTNGTRIRMVSSSSRTELLLHRQFADPLAGGGEDGVGDCWSRYRRTRLADPSRRLEIAHKVHFDGRRFVDPQHANVVEVGLLYPAVLQRRLSPKGAADPENDPTLDLRFHRVGVHHGAAVDRADDPVHADLARFGHRDLGDPGQITAPLAVEDGDTATTASWPRPAPTGLPRREVQDRLGARRLAQQRA